MYITIDHFYGNKQVQHIIVSPRKEISNKDIKIQILNFLQKKKDSYVEYQNYRFWLEDQYIYPDNETMFKYCECPEFKTGKKVISIKGEKLNIQVEKNTWLNDDQLFLRE